MRVCESAFYRVSTPSFDAIKRNDVSNANNKTSHATRFARRSRARVVEGDALEVLSTLADDSFDRAIVPRPKEGGKDGDMSTSLCGLPYLAAILPKLRSRGEIHWYDFASDAELEVREREERKTRQGTKSEATKWSDEVKRRSEATK